jgi:hypothetical protein
MKARPLFAGGTDLSVRITRASLFADCAAHLRSGNGSVCGVRVVPIETRQHEDERVSAQDTEQKRGSAGCYSRPG